MTKFVSVIKIAKEEDWETIWVDWQVLDFPFCLKTALGHSALRLNAMSNS